MLDPERLQVLWRPFIASLVVIFIHGYLGIHVIARKVIFVDIALAQIAAMGAMIGVLQGFEPGSESMILFSMGFAVFAAAVFAVTRTRQEHVPQEAVIGLSYAIAAAAAILLAAKSPHGAEHLNQLVAGNVLFARWDQIWKAAIVYGSLLLIHCFLGRRFLLISEKPDEAYATGMNVRFWDFLFYATFAIAITHSVQIVGVLLVFCYLVAPAVFSVMFAQRFWSRLAIGWTMAIVVSAIGLDLGFDYPTSPSIMCVFAFVLVGGGIVKSLMVSTNRLRTGGTILSVGACLVLAFWAVFHYVHPSAEEHHHDEDHADDGARGEKPPEHPVGSGVTDLRRALADKHAGVRAEAAEKLGALHDRSVVPDLIRVLDMDRSDQVKEKAAIALDQIGAVEAAPGILRTLPKQQDEWVRLRMAQALARMGAKEAVPILLHLAQRGEARKVREEAVRTLLLVFGRDDKQVVGELVEWWTDNGGQAEWDPGKKAFVPKR